MILVKKECIMVALCWSFFACAMDTDQKIDDMRKEIEEARVLQTVQHLKSLIKLRNNLRGEGRKQELSKAYGMQTTFSDFARCDKPVVKKVQENSYFLRHNMESKL